MVQNTSSGTFLCLLLSLSTIVSSWHVSHSSSQPNLKTGSSLRIHPSNDNDNDCDDTVFDDFCGFLREKQSEIITQLEQMDGSDAKFSRDCWGMFDSETNAATTTKSGGITRVLQGGNVIEKGACSLTVIQQGTLSQERALAIKSRQDDLSVKEGDTYSAAALSIVLHSRSPLVPTFRSDVRIFVVKSSSSSTVAWFGGGADLTPYYLDEDDITQFHALYQKFTYDRMKKACDDYFFLPARSEHRGTGGIFFDDLPASAESLAFVKGVANAWVPSWLPIVTKHCNSEYTQQQRQWQLLRRGRYLEFNLLYDRGVKFGLATESPRVEGVMVSAPPLIAFEYNRQVDPGSREALLLEVLKDPKDWV